MSQQTPFVKQREDVNEFCGHWMSCGYLRKMCGIWARHTVRDYYDKTTDVFTVRLWGVITSIQLLDYQTSLPLHYTRCSLVNGRKVGPISFNHFFCMRPSSIKVMESCVIFTVLFHNNYPVLRCLPGSEALKSTLTWLGCTHTELKKMLHTWANSSSHLFSLHHILIIQHLNQLHSSTFVPEANPLLMTKTFVKYP